MEDKNRIEKARGYYCLGSDKDKQMLADIFPELRESEDERIIQNLIDAFTEYKKSGGVDFHGIEINTLLAWLEKQKEQIEELSTRLNGLMQEYVKSGKDEEEQEHRLKCYQLFWDALGDSEFFKQKEQKPVKLDDDTEVGLDRALQIVKDAKGNLCGYQSDDGIYECCHAIQTLERILKNGIEQKPAEYLDKDKVYAIMNKLHRLSFSQLIPINSDEFKKIGEITSDVRSLLDYPIAQKLKDEVDENVELTPFESALFSAFSDAWQEYMRGEAVNVAQWAKEHSEELLEVAKEDSVKWSEEDEQHLEWLCRIVHSRKVHGELSLAEESELGKWMDKWLNHNPNPRWKPSEEQMNVLKEAIFYFGNSWVSHKQEVLESIYNDLKSL